MLSKDVENYTERKGLVDSKISKFASHVRSEMKTVVRTSWSHPGLSPLDDVSTDLLCV